MPMYLLNQMIFTFNKKLTDEDTTNVKGAITDLDKVIRGLRCMKGIDDDYIPDFKFFQFKKSFVKDLTNDHERIMLTFNDIS
jgi:hypothetical protein